MADTSELIIFAVIIVFVLGRRLLRNRSGAQYSIQSIFLTPLIYIVLTAFFVVGLALWQDAALFAAIVVGTLVGLVLGKRSDIFEKDGKVMYRRSTEVMILWIVAFVIRIGIDYLYNPYLTLEMSGAALNATTTAAMQVYESGPIIFGADLLLALSAGLLLGEAIVLYRNHSSKYKSAKPTGG